MRYKGKYRLHTPIDLVKNTFPREHNGQFAERDVYIDCQNKIQISHYGRGILECYIPSIGRGRNIIKAIKEEFHGEDIISNIVETDAEVLFRFAAKDIERLEPFLKPKTFGANISPFSSRNLPKNKAYKIPDEDLLRYKNIASKLPQKDMILLGKYTRSFIQSLATKKHTYEDIKADMAIKGLRGKEYIHSIGKWEQYIKYLQNNMKKESNNED